jgi:hypothetical protein
MFGHLREDVAYPYEQEQGASYDTQSDPYAVINNALKDCKEHCGKSAGVHQQAPV